MSSTYNKKALENMNQLLTYIEQSREDLVNCCKMLLSALKKECEHSKELEAEIGRLQATNRELELVRNKVQQDLLHFREAYTKEMIRNDDLTKMMKSLESKLAQKNNVAINMIEESSQDQPKTEVIEESEVATENEVHELPEMPQYSSPEPTTTATEANEKEKEKEMAIVEKKTSSSIVISPDQSGRLNSFTSTRLTSSTYTLALRPPSSHSTPRRSTMGQKADEEEHKFEEMSKFHFNTCQLCKASIMPLSKFFSCANCGLKVDRACYENGVKLGVACVEKKAKSLANLITPDSEVAVPELLQKCCEKIEERGLAQSDLYQVNEEKEAAKLYAKYLSTKDVSTLKLHKVDIAALSGLVLHILGKLEQPLIDAKSLPDFERACDPSKVQQRVEKLQELMERLAKPNRHSLAFLLLHLKRVMAKSFVNGVDKQTLALLFGPYIASYSQAEKTATTREQIQRANMQQQIVHALLELPNECFKKSLSDQSETVPLKRRTTNFGNMLMNDRQRESFYNNLSNFLY